jgi:sensor domain CHASE-containing protein
MAAMGARDRRSVVEAAVVFAAVLAVGALVASHLQGLERAGRQRSARELAHGSAFAIEQRFAFALAAASTLGEMVSAGATDAQLDAVARRQLSLAGATLSVQLARDAVISHIWPREGNEAAFGLDLLRSPIHGPFVRRLVDQRVPLLYEPFDLVQGGTGLALRVPIFTGPDRRF